MGWIEHVPAKQKNIKSRAPMKASIVQYRDGSPPHVTITLTVETAKDLGLEENARLKAYVGDGDKRGLIRLVPGEGEIAVRKRGFRGGPQFRIDLGAIHALVMRREARRPVTFAKVDGGVEVRLPSVWSWHEPVTPQASSSGPSEQRMRDEAVARKRRLGAG